MKYRCAKGSGNAIIVNSKWQLGLRAKQKLTRRLRIRDLSLLLRRKRSTNKVKKYLETTENIQFLFHLTHILEISRFEVFLGFFLLFFQNQSPDLHVLGVGGFA